MGKTLDQAINLEYIAKKKEGKGLKSSVITDAAAQVFDDEKGNSIFGKDEKPEELKDIAINTTKTFHEEICPLVNPADVQKRGEISFENTPYSLVGIVDVVDLDGTVIDNKYTGRTWPLGKEFDMLDPVIYSLWFETEYGKEEKGFRFDVGVGLKSAKTFQRAIKVSEAEKAGFLKYMAGVYDSMQHSLETGMFLPRKDHFLCSQRKCGYWKLCSKEFGFKIKP